MTYGIKKIWLRLGASWEGLRVPAGWCSYLAWRNLELGVSEPARRALELVGRKLEPAGRPPGGGTERDRR